MSDRIFQTLLLGALGDALGAPIEFSQGPFSDHAPEKPKGFEWTDDTQMTLFIAEALSEVLPGLPSPDVGNTVDGVPLLSAERNSIVWAASRRGVVRWYSTQTEVSYYRDGPDEDTILKADLADSTLATDKRMQHSRAPGGACLTGCRLQVDAGKPVSREGEQGGCGAVMRAAPYGLLASSPDEARGWAHAGGKLTHGDPIGTIPAGLFAEIIWRCANGATLADAVAATETGMDTDPTGIGRFMRQILGMTTEGGASSDEGLRGDALCTAFGRGWDGVSALAIALYVVMYAEAHGQLDRVGQTLWHAVAHPGDSDSTGAIAGNLLGALGKSAPEGWEEALKPIGGAELIREVADRITPSKNGPLLAERAGGAT